MDEFKSLEFLASKSHQLLEKQVTSIRQKHSNAATIITVLVLFIPFIFSRIGDSFFLIKCLALIPIALLIWSIILLIQVLRSKPLDHGFHVNKFDELVNNSYEDILLYEIGANTGSFTDNIIISDSSNNKYNRAIKLTVIATIVSTLLLVISEFFSPEKIPSEVKIVNPIYMSEEKKNEGTKEKKYVIPVVPPVDRAKLSEGVDIPKTSTKDTNKNKKN